VHDLDPAPLPPPPRVLHPVGLRWPKRIARGSTPPLDLTFEIRAIAPPVVWSRVVPVSTSTGLPLLARDRAPSMRPLVDRIDRAAPALALALATLAALLLICLGS
jgi:hypothetical protein